MFHVKHQTAKGKVMEYKIIRSDRKSLTMQITSEGEVVIKAPMFISDEKIANFVEEHTSWVENRLPQAKNRAEVYLSADAIDGLPAMAKTAMAVLVARYAPKMNIVPKSVRITGAKSRFGSCTGDRIVFSKYLLFYPIKAVEYVAVHELAHIVHPNHSRDFYGLVKQLLPDYKQREKLLRPEQASLSNLTENLEILRVNS